VPTPLSPRDFVELVDDAQIVDTRMDLGFAAAHIPNAQFIWLNGLASFAGWFLSYEKPILLLTEGNDTREVVRILIRLGFDDISGFLAGGMLSWHMAGLHSFSQQTIIVQDFCHLLDQDFKPWILDVRNEAELNKDGRIPGAQHIHITQIAERRDEVPKDRKVYVFCGSGLRSMIAASYLEHHGWKDLVVILGGFAGWKSVKCPIKRSLAK
jgi:hydroxyacylglutathione hydrolase